MAQNLYAKGDEGYMKVTKVRNQEPAPIQISAEQLVIEAQAYISEDIPAPNLNIFDAEELEDYKYKTRKTFEDQIRMQKQHMGTWRKYAKWEGILGEFERSRSIFERALEVNPYDTRVIEDYVEMEMKNKFFDHARNIWERGCYRLPGEEKLWLKYAEMEVRLGNYQNARDIYSSWMSHNPSENAWDVFLKFQERLGEYENCREILKDYIDLNPSLKAYLKAAKFQQKKGNRDKARRFFERAFVELGELAIDADFIQQFCDFETKCKEYERARVLYKFGLDKLAGTEKAHQLSRKFVEFEKQYGSVENIDEVIFQKRRLHYQRELEMNPYKYDLWLDLAALEESEFQIENNREHLNAVREVYEKGIGNSPPQGAQKENWKRYIWLWLCYAIFEELREEIKDEDPAEKFERVDQIYKKALEITPHQEFTISKLWVMYAEFQIRCQNLAQA